MMVKPEGFVARSSTRFCASGGKTRRGLSEPSAATSSMTEMSAARSFSRTSAPVERDGGGFGAGECAVA